MPSARISSSVWSSMSLTTCHNLHESLVSVLIVKKLTPQGQRKGADYPQASLSVGDFSLWSSSVRVMVRNWVLQCYFLIKRLLKRHRDHSELHAIRSRMLPVGACKDDYVIRVSRRLTQPKIDINERFPFMQSFLYRTHWHPARLLTSSELIELASATAGWWWEPSWLIYQVFKSTFLFIDAACFWRTPRI